MNTRVTYTETHFNRINTMVFWCAFLASMVPRYISSFKIRIGINISLYTLIVAFTFVLFTHRVVFFKHIQSYFFLIWFFCVVLSVLRAEQIGEWAYYFDWTLTALLFEQILYSSDRYRVFDSLVKGLICGLIIHLIIGFIEISIHNYFFSVSIANRRYYGNVPVSIFHNPNDYVTFVVTVFPFTLYYLMKQKALIKRGLFISIVIFSIYLMVKSMSRSAFFALVLLGVSLIWLTYKKSKMNKLYIMIGFIVILGLFLCVQQIRSYIFSLFLTNRVNITSTDRARWNLIKNGFYFLKETHGAGVGAGNLRIWLSTRTVYNVNGLLLIHNWYVELLVTFGVVFFLLYIIFHFKIIAILIKNYNHQDKIWNFDNTVLISFIGFSIVSIASSSNIYSEWVWLYLVFVGTYAMFRETNKVI